MKYSGISFREALVLIGSYVKGKITEQIRSIAFIVLYLAAFQIFILRIPLHRASLIAVGIGLAVLGLAFFLEGLMLGLMPLGEFIGRRLPRKSPLVFIVLFAVILGAGATLAEPSVGILRTAGSSVKAWVSPLLYYILNVRPDELLLSIALGVGVSVGIGILRFAFGWSLKPLALGMTAAVAGLSLYAAADPRLSSLIGLAWDSGGVTTGPVTVPLVLALGIGVSRVSGKEDNPVAGFGLVTLASIGAVAAVFILGMINLNGIPAPMTEREFFSKEHRAEASLVAGSEDALRAYVFRNAGFEGRAAYAGGEQELFAYLRNLSSDAGLRQRVFGPSESAFTVWLFRYGTDAERQAVYPDRGALHAARASVTGSAVQGPVASDLGNAMKTNSWNAFRAIIPLSVFLVLFVLVVLRSKLPQADEMILGIFLSFTGMIMLSSGIELGLARLGNEVGTNIPASFTEYENPDNEVIIRNFDRSLVNRSVSPAGQVDEFFYIKDSGNYRQVPYDPGRHDAEAGTYRYSTAEEPLFSRFGNTAGLVLVFLFAFFMGYGATVAEPALSAMGTTIETITVGIFRRIILVRAVSIGVGFGLILGLVRLIWDVPLLYLLLPVYAVTAILTLFSSEEYVNIAWDSAGVTTGPVTVPLVLAMGLGIGSEVGIAEGFGILAIASAVPILTVLMMGLFVQWKRKRAEASEDTAV